MNYYIGDQILDPWKNFKIYIKEFLERGPQ